MTVRQPPQSGVGGHAGLDQENDSIDAAYTQPEMHQTESTDSFKISMSTVSPAPSRLSPPPQPPAQAAAASSTFDKYGKGFGTLIIRMVPDSDSSALRSPTPPWIARLAVKCDVPRLMREGFFWAADNTLPEEGYITHSLGREWTDKGFRCMRRWILVDKSNTDGAPRWIARLNIATKSLENLARCHPRNLARRYICSANAWDASHRLVYNYKRMRPSENLNCVYDHKALDGWWPWPKGDRGSSGSSSAYFGPRADWDDVFTDCAVQQSPSRSQEVEGCVTM